MDDKKPMHLGHSPAEDVPAPGDQQRDQQDRGSQRADEEQTISVGQGDDLQSNRDENFYQNRERGNMPEGDSRNDEGGGSLF